MREARRTSGAEMVWVPNGSLGDNKWTIKDGGAGFNPGGDRRYITVVWGRRIPAADAACRMTTAEARRPSHRLPCRAVGDQSKTDDTQAS